MAKVTFSDGPRELTVTLLGGALWFDLGSSHFQMNHEDTNLLTNILLSQRNSNSE